MARGRWIAAMGGVLLLVMGLVSVSGGLRAARAVWAGADPVPSSGAAPREVRYLLQTRLADRSGAALQADRAVLIQRLRSSGIAPAHLILLPPRRIAVILPAGRARPFLTILLTETGAVTVQGSRAVGGAAAAPPHRPVSYPRAQHGHHGQRHPDGCPCWPWRRHTPCHDRRAGAAPTPLRDPEQVD